MNRFCARVVVCLALVHALAGDLLADTITMYRILDLGELRTGPSQAVAINEAGDTAGSVRGAKGDQAAHWTRAGSTRLLGTFDDGEGYSRASALNDQGLVVGTSSLDGLPRAFRTDRQGALVDLGLLAGGSWSEATGINASGQVVGFGNSSTPGVHAFKTAPDGGLTFLGTPFGGTSSWAWDINDAGQVIGDYQHWLGRRAFLHDPAGGFTDLGSLGGSIFARALNDDGWVTGSSMDSSGQFVPFLFRPGRGLSSIGLSMGVNGGIGLDVNNLGQIVGTLTPSFGPSNAFVWSFETGLVDLNERIDPDLGWQLTSATAINDSGMIAGAGVLDGRERAVLLTPFGHAATTPEPATWLMTALGAGGLGLFQWRARRRARAK